MRGESNTATAFCFCMAVDYLSLSWLPSHCSLSNRYKKTVICQEVAKAKNVCQCCLLDLDYNLPVQVRDYALGLQKEDEPTSTVGREYQLQKQMDEGSLASSFANQRPSDLLMKLQRATPYYKRNQAKICSFFVKGECNRGAECPYRHEMPPENQAELNKQNYHDRYYGVNDPVANKMMKRAADMPKQAPPVDQTVMTLYIGGIDPETTKEADVRDQFYSYGEIASVRLVPAKTCAFVTFTTRLAAEKAMEEKQNMLFIKGQKLRLMWGKPKEAGGGGGGGGGRGPEGGAGPSHSHPAVGHIQAAMGLAGGGAAAGMANPYSAMDPQQMGTRVPWAPSEKHPSGKTMREEGEGDELQAKRARGGEA